MNLEINIFGVPSISVDVSQCTTTNYVDGLPALKVFKSGDTMTGILKMGDNSITSVGDPINAQDVVTKNYVTQLGLPNFVVVTGTIPTTTNTNTYTHTHTHARARAHTLFSIWKNNR